MEDQVKSRLQDLRASVNKLEGLCAWLDLKKSERDTKCGRNIEIYDPTENEMKAEYGFFLKTLLDLKSSLSKLPFSNRYHFRQVINHLEKRVETAMRDVKTRNF